MSGQKDRFVLFQTPQRSRHIRRHCQKIQKSAYDLSHLKQKDIITPPYLDIAEQLQVDDDQIFRAAVYNLTNIAVNEERYAAEIIKALEETAFQCNRSGEQLDYVKSKINIIKNKLRNK